MLFYLVYADIVTDHAGYVFILCENAKDKTSYINEVDFDKDTKRQYPATWFCELMYNPVPRTII